MNHHHAPIKVGLLGLGTVGAGTVRLLRNNAAEIERRTGCEVQIVHAAARDLKKPRDCDLDGIRLSDDPALVVDDPEISVLVELMGGEEPARSLILRAIEAGKHVVTANKSVIAMHGTEIFAAADQRGVVVEFEAAVAGGIPIIKAIREALASNRIEWVAGIINGTGNFILSQMLFEDIDFATALGEAQALGYAEADPAYDVEGIDAAQKLAILAAIAFGIPLAFDRVYTEGITHITRADIDYAKKLGYRIKHLGIAKQREDGVELRVHPTLVEESLLLANVEGVKNAVMVHGDAVGSTVYYGPGAGAGPTASAVVADLMDVVRIIAAGAVGSVPHLAFHSDRLANPTFLEPEDFDCAHYLRLQVEDLPGVMAKVTGILAEEGISIEHIMQKDPEDHGDDAVIIIVTKLAREGRLHKAIERITNLEYMRDGVVHIRTATFED